MLNILENYDVTLVPIKNTEIPLIKMPVYVINLNVNNYRRGYIRHIAKKMKINYTLVIVKKITNEIKDQINKTLKSGIIGCYLSHMWCIKNAIEHNYQHFLVFEDDIVFSKNFETAFTQLNYRDYDMIQLGCCDFNFHENVKNGDIHNNMYSPKKLALGAYGNIYNINFAKLVFKERLNNCRDFDVGFDMYYNKYKMGICCPNIITTELSTTDLQHDFSFFNTFKNDYFINKCFKNFDYSSYYFVWITFIKHCHKYYIDNNKQMLLKLDYDKIIDEFCVNQNDKKKNLIKHVLYNNGISVHDINKIMNIIEEDNYL